MANISKTLALAVGHHQAGRLQDAEKLYREILAVEPKQVDATHLLGVMAAQFGKHDVAVEYIRRAIAMKGNVADFHNNLGESYRALRRLPEAIACCRQAIKLNPRFAEAHNNLGNVLKEQGKLDEAIACYRRAVEMKPRYSQAHSNLGAALADRGELDKSIASYRRALELNPSFVEAHLNLGNALRGQGKLDEAIACHRRALQLQPQHPEAHGNLGVALADKEELDEAIACLRRAIELQPNSAMGHSNLGSALMKQGKLVEAVACFRQALSLKPDYIEACNNLGNALQDQGNLDEAAACYRRALELNPKLALAHNNLGNTLRIQDRLVEAETCLRDAIRLDPQYAEAHFNLGVVYAQQCRIADGMNCYAEALRLEPQLAEAHFNRSLVLLAAGDFERGWPEYEWRFKMRRRPTDPAHKHWTSDPVTMWDGSPLDGRTLLLRAEQGIGDAAQFMRYALSIPRGTGGTVILECPAPLIDLARTCNGIDHLMARGEPLPPYDVVAPLLSVPGLLKTTLATIPANIPYIHADPARVDYWKKELATLPGVRVGISWQGSVDHVNDRVRSVPLARFATLAEIPGVTLCSLQKGHGSEQLARGIALELPVHDFGSRTAANFADTGALLHALDLVVTVDTAIAHVAGALGVPVWVMIAAASDWRWLTDRDDSPWYPTMRLFRQPKPGDWDTVFSDVAKALQLRAKNTNSSRVVSPLRS